jgi:pimeloyl-ACP methyl ester carboxylesterase
MSSVVWMDFVRRLAPGRRVIAPDLPGHGQSDRWHDPETPAGLFSLYRDAVGTVCATLKVPRAVLVGHSMGAAVALHCALAWPERVAGLVLISGAARLDVPDEVMTLLQDSFPPSSPRVDRMPDSFAELCFSPETSPDVKARWQAVLFSAERDILLADFSACRGLDFRGKLAERLGRGASSPLPWVLAISGSDDLLVPPSQVEESVAILKAAGVRTSHEVIKNTGHLTHLEQSETCIRLITDAIKL